MTRNRGAETLSETKPDITQPSAAVAKAFADVKRAESAVRDARHRLASDKHGMVTAKREAAEALAAFNAAIGKKPRNPRAKKGAAK